MKIGIDGIKIGNFQDEKALTGASVVICEKGAVAGVDVRGGAPGTRETDLLDPVNTVEKIHAVVLSGGSAFGLAASDGVMRFLEEKGVGFDTGFGKVPIVVQAVLFDLGLGDPKVRPDAAMGYEAARSAKADFEIGCCGAGTGASVGKLRGMDFAMKSGLGYSEYRTREGLIVGALVAVNAVGDVCKDGKIMAGALAEDRRSFADSSSLLLSGDEKEIFPGTNTTIGVVVTNAALTKAQAKKVAQTAHNGYARAIRPVHTGLDGDSVFVMATGEKKTSPDLVMHLAALQMEKAVQEAVIRAESAGGLPSFSDIK
ncbi:MAG: P1 family peptidase [Peptostreptococcaceae bacterium]|nr:P1 family peptidase [Peptostreptococcaceae bacterium]